MLRPVFPLCLLSLSLLGCAAVDAERPKPKPLPKSTVEQKELMEQVHDMFRVGSDELPDLLRKGKADPVAAKALSLYFVWHMHEALQIQRQRQVGALQVRTLEDNERYVQAREALRILGAPVVAAVRERLIEPVSGDRRAFGVSVLASLQVDALPAIAAALGESKPKYRRYYADAVSQMKPSPEAEQQLVNWASSEDFTVRSKALVGLARYGKRHLTRLRGIVAKDPDAFVQRRVVESLSAFRDRQTVAAIVQFYDRCVKSGDDRGATSAERTLVKMSGHPPSRGKKRIHYGLAHWQKWVMTLPADGEGR